MGTENLTFLTLFFVSVGLGLDALVVSISSGMALKKIKGRDAFKIAFFFGFFQALMPIIGWLAGMQIRVFVESFAHWIAFGILLYIGIKMIRESEEMQKSCLNVLDMKTLLMLSIAVSIDAFAVGVSFAFLNIAIINPAIVIGIITFIMSLSGVFIGTAVCSLIEGRLSMVGGIILIIIGIKILAEKLFD